MIGLVHFDLHSWWHAGTGRGAGERADSVVQRTPGGLPYLPGRTVKGLLRAGARLWASLETAQGRAEADEEVRRWFGSELLDPDPHTERLDALERDRFRSTPGLLRFSSATLGREWEAWAADQTEGDLMPLYSTLSSTRISRRGVAQDRTLRTLEVAVPMKITAQIDGPDRERWLPMLAGIAPLIRSIGTGRNRGLGRVTVTVEAEQ